MFGWWKEAGNFSFIMPCVHLKTLIIIIQLLKELKTSVHGKKLIKELNWLLQCSSLYLIRQNMISCSMWGTSDTATDVECIEVQKNENHTLWMVVTGKNGYCTSWWTKAYNKNKKSNGTFTNNNLQFFDGRRLFHSQNRSAQQQCLITQLHFEPAPNKGGCKSAIVPSLCVTSL